jgi:hypothetical protein
MLCALAYSNIDVCYQSMAHSMRGMNQSRCFELVRPGLVGWKKTFIWLVGLKLSEKSFDQTTFGPTIDPSRMPVRNFGPSQHCVTLSVSRVVKVAAWMHATGPVSVAGPGELNDCVALQ